MKQSTAVFRVVRCWDPAIDGGEETGTMMVRYAETRDWDLLRFVDESAGKPTIYHCRPLTLAQRRHVTQALDQDERHRRAFAHAVLRVEHWIDESGSVTTWSARDESKAMKDDQLERFAEDDVQEIGHVVVRKSFLPRGLPLRLPVLDSSRAACLTVLSLFVEPRLAAQTQAASP